MYCNCVPLSLTNPHCSLPVCNGNMLFILFTMILSNIFCNLTHYASLLFFVVQILSAFFHNGMYTNGHNSCRSFPLPCILVGCFVGISLPSSSSASIMATAFLSCAIASPSFFSLIVAFTSSSSSSRIGVHSSSVLCYFLLSSTYKSLTYSVYLLGQYVLCSH